MNRRDLQSEGDANPRKQHIPCVQLPVQVVELSQTDFQSGDASWLVILTVSLTNEDQDRLISRRSGSHGQEA